MVHFRKHGPWVLAVGFFLAFGAALADWSLWHHRLTPHDVFDRISEGMSKDEVLAAVGNPEAIEGSPTVEVMRWYWYDEPDLDKSSFESVIVEAHFDSNGKVWLTQIGYSCKTRSNWWATIRRVLEW